VLHNLKLSDWRTAKLYIYKGLELPAELTRLSYHGSMSASLGQLY